MMSFLIEANECFEKGLYESAISYYVSFLQIDVKKYKYFCKRGKQFSRLGKEQLAIESFIQEYKCVSVMDLAQYLRGLSCLYLKNYQNAIRDFTEVIQRCPQFKFCFYDRGKAHADLYQLEYAIYDYTEAIKLDEFYVTAYYHRGILFDHLERKSDAINDYTKSIEINPLFVQAYCKRGRSLNKYLGRKQDAINDYSKAIDINPLKAEAYNSRGVLLSDLGRKNEARNDYSKAIEINPEYAEAYFNRGVLFDDLGRKEDAINDYNKAIEINILQVEAYINRGIIFYHMGRTEDAINDYNKALEINPQYAEAYNNRGNSLSNLGSKQDALNDYTKAIEINELYAEAYFNRGVILDDMERKQDAFNDYFQAFLITPQNPLYNVQLGRFHLRNNEKQEAHKYFSNSLKIMETLTKQDQKNYNLSDSHINYIKDQVELIQSIENDLEKIKSIIQSKILSEEKQDQLLKEIQPIEEDYRNQFLQSIDKDQKKASNDQLVYILQRLNDLERQNQILINENIILKKDFQQQKQDIQYIQNQKRYRIEKEMNIIKQDNNRYIYYQSLYWRLSNYISACQLLSTELFKKNPIAVIDNNGEIIANISKQVVKQISNVAGSIPIIGSVITIISSSLEIVLDSYLNYKFNKIVKKLTQIVQVRCSNRYEIDEEIQLAVIELSKQLPNIQNDSQQEEQSLLNYIKQIWNTVEQQIWEIDINSGNEKAKDPYWKLGVVDTLKALHHLVLFQEDIQKDRKRDLHLIILDSLNEKMLNVPKSPKLGKPKGQKRCQIQ